MAYNVAITRWYRGVLLVASMIILVNLLVDVLYGIVNPRIRHKH